MEFLDQINRRRTFGIISHPDAGKTTLTEKLARLSDKFLKTNGKGSKLMTLDSVFSNKNFEKLLLFI